MSPTVKTSIEIDPAASGYVVYQLGTNDLVGWMDMATACRMTTERRFWMKRCTYGEFLRNKERANPSADRKRS